MRRPSEPAPVRTGEGRSTIPDVVVVGGGTIGLCCAWRCAQAGASVVLADPAPRSGASVVAPGMLAPVTEVHYGEESLLQLNIASARLWPDFVAELEDASGIGCAYERHGTLFCARDADDVAALEHVFAFQRELGLDVTRLTGSESRELEPGLSPRVRGAIYARDDHRVDPAALTRALLTACERAGAKLVNERVVSISEDPAVVTEVSTHPAGAVVVAAGAQSAALRLPDGVHVPVRPVKGQVLTLRSSGEPLADANIRGIDGYVVPRRDGTVAVGATMEELGFDKRVTAEGVRDLLDAAYELLPGIVSCEFVGAAVGFRPGTPDNAPLLGRSAVDGIFLATGHFRNGILLTPITGRLIADEVAGLSAPETAAFSPQRFAA